MFVLRLSFGNRVSLYIDSPGEPGTHYIDWPRWSWTHRDLSTCLPRAVIKGKCYHAQHICYKQYMPWELNQKVGIIRQSKSWCSVDILGWFCDAEHLQALMYSFALSCLIFSHYFIFYPILITPDYYYDESSFHYWKLSRLYHSLFLLHRGHYGLYSTRTNLVSPES